MVIHLVINSAFVFVGLPPFTLLQLYQSILLVALMIISVLWTKNWIMKRRLKAGNRQDPARERVLSNESAPSMEVSSKAPALFQPIERM